MKIRATLTVIILSALLAACNFTLAEDITPPPNYIPPTPAPTMGALYPAVPPSPVRGKTIFEVKCAPCHGEDGLGNGPQAGGLPVPVSAIGLRDIASQSNPGKWYTVITQGQIDRYMPPFASLSDAERWDVLSYVYTLSNPSDQTEQGAALYVDLCSSCHGPEGDASKGSISGSPVDFTDQAFMAQVTSLGMFQVIANGLPSKMDAYKPQLTDSEIWALTAYLRTLVFDHSVPVAQAASPPTVEVVATVLPTETSEALNTPDATAMTGEATPDGTQAAEVNATATAEFTATPDGLFGKVTGQITNGSGGPLPSNLSVVLHGYVNMSETLTLTANVNSDGSYEFNEVPLETDLALIITTDVDGTSYNSDVAVYDGSSNIFELPLTVYETSTDISAISADRVHIFFDFSNTGLIQVIEIYILSNSSNKTIVAEEANQAVLSYILPDGASNLQFEVGQIGNPFLSTENGFGDPTNILPGASSYQLMYAFDMPYGKEIEINQPINVPIGSVIVMSPDGVTVQSDQLADTGKRDVQGQSYSMYSVENLEAGATLSMVISGMPKTGSSTGGTTGSSQTSLVIGLAIFGAVLILAGVFFFLRGRSNNGLVEEEYDPNSSDAIGNDADRLMDAIVSLDDQYKAGRLSEEAYQNRRTELKNRLKNIL